MFKKMIMVMTLVALICIVLSCWEAKPTLEDQNALKALGSIQSGLESSISLEAYLDLLKAAKTEIGILKGAPQKNACFLGAVEKCYASYEIAGKAWRLKNEALDSKRKQDMDMTMAFSISFATLNIEKANNCFKK